MKIGILTFHRAINYGAVLQTYALQETLRGLGHDVSVIDYRQSRVEKNDRKPVEANARIKLLKGLHLRSWLKYNKNRELVELRRKRFDDFLSKNLNLSTPCDKENVPHMDAYVIGSDQVWNSMICDGLDPVFWGDFNHDQASKVFSYAASTSVSNLRNQSQDIIQNLLQNFTAISVREKQTQDYINQNFSLEKPVQLVLDPTLLATKSIWESLINDCPVQGNYVLYFGARNSKDYPSVLLDKATSLARQYGCETKCIDFNSDSPADFVNKFKFARAVVTSSFHGVAFSLIFNRPLYAIKYGDEQDSRYVEVLTSVGAEDMLVDLHQEVTIRNFDYAIVNNKISELRVSSLEYLKQL